MANNKLWAVKAFQWGEDKETALNYKEGTICWIRQYVLIMKDLTFQKAKEIRNQYSRIGAMITRNPPEEELKVVTLD